MADRRAEPEPECISRHRIEKPKSFQSSSQIMFHRWCTLCAPRWKAVYLAGDQSLLHRIQHICVDEMLIALFFGCYFFVISRQWYLINVVHFINNNSDIKTKMRAANKIEMKMIGGVAGCAVSMNSKYMWDWMPRRMDDNRTAFVYLTTVSYIEMWLWLDA